MADELPAPASKLGAINAHTTQGSLKKKRVKKEQPSPDDNISLSLTCLSQQITTGRVTPSFYNVWLAQFPASPRPALSVLPTYSAPSQTRWLGHHC